MHGLASERHAFAKKTQSLFDQLSGALGFKLNILTKYYQTARSINRIEGFKKDICLGIVLPYLQKRLPISYINL